MCKHEGGAESEGGREKLTLNAAKTLNVKSKIIKLIV